MAEGRAKRVRVLHISNATLVEMFRRDDRTGKRVRLDGMPEDARIINVSDQARFLYDQTSFLIESDTFDEVRPGDAIPTLNLIAHELPATDDCHVIRG